MTNAYFQGHHQANKWTDPEKNPRKRWIVPVPDQSSTATLSPGEMIALPYELEAPTTRTPITICGVNYPHRGNSNNSKYLTIKFHTNKGTSSWAERTYYCYERC
jgi:hypothetical protein